jgi:hypothetical protein
MAGSNQKPRKQPRGASRAPRKDEQSRARQVEETGHHLRGADSANDFVDSESDSCVVVHRRDEKESDS